MNLNVSAKIGYTVAAGLRGPDDDSEGGAV